MTEYGLDPAYIRLDYHSAYGPHTAIIKTLPWLPSSITGSMGSYVSWSTAPVDAEAMIDAQINLMKVFLKPDSSFDLATIYTKASPTALSVVEAVKSLGVAGTSAAGGVSKAVQATFNFKTTIAGNTKLVFLDYPHGTGDFNKQTFVDFSPAAIALFTNMADVTNAWAGRDNHRISSFVSVTNTLNEKLRKAYKMA